MSDFEKVDSGAGPDRSPGVPDAVAAGRMIRAAREAAGLHIGALAVAMKVPVSKLESLENGTLTALSGPVFSRALASSVCRALKVDPESILQALPRAPAAQLQQMGALNEPFRTAAGTSQTRLAEWLLKPTVLAVAVLLTGVGVLFYLPEIRGLYADEGTAPGLATDQATGGSPTPRPAGPLAEPLLPASSVGAGLPAKAADAAVAGGTDGAGLLAFKASAPSWVEVSDAKGAMLLRRTLTGGELVQVSGVPPLKVVVGRADAIEVTVRGKPILLQEWSKDNVARFEVK